MGFIQALDVFGKLLGIGASLKSIFGGTSAPSLEDIVAAVKNEVRAVFFGSELEDETISAAGSLQAAHDFFAIDYKNAQDNAETEAELWELLNSTEAPGLASLSAVKSTVEGWLTATDSQPAPKDQISKAISVCLGVYLHICLLHRERAANAPSDAQKNAELDDMHDYASEALQHLQSRVMTVISERLGSLDFETQIGGEAERKFASITDSWFDGGSNRLQVSGPAFRGPDPAAVMQAILHAYRRLLWTGTDDDRAVLLNALNNPMISDQDHPYSDDGDLRGQFIQNSLDGVQSFGQWAASARGVLGSLDSFAMGFPGETQDDWHWCATCGELYFGWSVDDGQTRCPAGGAHNTANSADYSLHFFPLSAEGTTPSSAQNGWRWCSKCNALHFPASGGNICANGGSHDASKSVDYFLPYGTVPATTGLTPQTGWSYCHKCSVLYYSGSATSVCASDKQAHDSTGSNQYWLSSMGWWPVP